jgi:hypothetical protein
VGCGGRMIPGALSADKVCVARSRGSVSARVVGGTAAFGVLDAALSMTVSRPCPSTAGIATRRIGADHDDLVADHDRTHHE